MDEDKNFGNPFLHDLIKACLVYDAPIIFNKLKKIFPKWKLLKENKVIRASEEFRLIRYKYFRDKKKPNKKKADVVWILRSGSYIIHEIKTGFFDINELLNDYYQTYIYYKGIKKQVITQDARLLIWATPKWIKYYKNEITKNKENYKVRWTYFSKEIKRLFINSKVRFVPINLLKDVLIDRINKVNNIIQNLDNNYKKIKELVKLPPHMFFN